MRIAGGRFRGRVLGAPKGMEVRPTSDKIRQAVFNMLLQYGLPDGAQVLDMFCGTGALGLEAVSRGAEFCLFLDKNPQILACARRNAGMLGVEAQCAFMVRDSARLAVRGAGQIPANLVFLDPPYRQALALRGLNAAAAGGWLAPGAVCVIETEAEAELYVPEGFSFLRKREYGGTQVVLCAYGPDAAAVPRSEG